MIKTPETKLKTMVKNLDAVKNKKTKLCNLDCKNCKYNQRENGDRIIYSFMCTKYGICGDNAAEIKTNVLFELS
jgi:sulfatase maturation enzyme AslB (radical SAM superfamily)